MSEKIRNTGLECPWSIYQILSYILYTGNILVFFIQIITEYPAPVKIVMISIYTTLFLLVFYYLIKLTISDPTDPIVKTFKNTESHM